MKKLFSLIVSTLATLSLSAQGWPAQYEGVMLQGFYWDSFSQSQWVKLEKQADELSQYFSLVWLPQSADCGGTSMGYDDQGTIPLMILLGYVAGKNELKINSDRK